jgi:dTDP-4-dehydrorhamnose reductase
MKPIRINHYLLLSFLFFLINTPSVCTNDTSLNSKKILIFGAKGWIGEKMVKLFEEQQYAVFAAQSRLENRESVVHEIESIMPDCVLNVAGITGRPNIDWCEDHHQETLRANIIGAVTLADVCFMHNIHMINFGTGCIFEYDSKHPVNSGKGFKEEDEPNFAGSFYSRTKIILEKLLQLYPNVLNLRLRMPISDDLHERSFVTKITKYKKVINIPNSMTILADLLPTVIEMAQRKLTGIYNFVNPGTISHNEVLELYKKYIDPIFTYENFTIEEHDKILKARRSNNELDASKLLREFPGIPHIQDSIIKVFERMKLNLQNNK